MVKRRTKVLPLEEYELLLLKIKQQQETIEALEKLITEFKFVFTRG